MTEDRFQKMTLAQWIFHYIEVGESDNESIDIQKALADYKHLQIQGDLDLLSYVINPDRAKVLLEVRSEVESKNKREKDAQNRPKEEQPNEESKQDEAFSLLSDEERELMAFMTEQDSTVLVQEERQKSEFILDTVDVEKIKLGVDIPE